MSSHLLSAVCVLSDGDFCVARWVSLIGVRLGTSSSTVARRMVLVLIGDFRMGLSMDEGSDWAGSVGGSSIGVCLRGYFIFSFNSVEGFIILILKLELMVFWFTGWLSPAATNHVFFLPDFAVGSCVGWCLM